MFALYRLSLFQNERLLSFFSANLPMQWKFKLIDNCSRAIITTFRNTPKEQKTDKKKSPKNLMIVFHRLFVLLLGN